MKCEEVSKQLMGYLDRRTVSAGRREVEDHFLTCVACRRRAEEFRELWRVLDEMPVVEPSLGFNARLRERLRAEPEKRWFGRLMPAPRLVFSIALLLTLSVWVSRLPRDNSGGYGTAAPSEQEDFNAIRDLGVLENYDVVTKFDALSELIPTSAGQPEPEPDHRTSDD
ncbi:MAG TPA: zf-HC2 domain-containing protein [Verrucomicrobiae bacterium]|jgi:hypothetical protein|nr:zf-HC2 domain-containing protein [Verrucomicrobiae bacterium]